MKRILVMMLILLMCCSVFCGCSGNEAGSSSADQSADVENNLIVFDTDAGTDDACAMLIMKNMGIDPGYIVATGGNASADGAVRNSTILKKYLGMDSVIVRGFETQLSTEKNTFHGEDGLANISQQMMEDLSITDEDVNSEMSLEDFKKQLLQYDNITYLSVGPLSTLADLISDDEIKSRLDKLYLMGGGINEFNCSHDTEFNFSKNPEAVEKVLSSGLDISLFTLDVSNHQLITADQIDMLEATGNLPEYVTFLRYNRQANIEYNNIDAAVLHDTLPVLYMVYPDKFETEEANITCDEYAHLEKNDKGYRIRLATDVEDDLLFDSLMECFKAGL